jgi:hypothetical protein
MEKVKKHLNTLRQKPEHIRKQIAFGVSSGITVVIILFWVVSLSASTSSTESDTSVQSPVASLSSSLTASASDAFAPIKNLFMSFFPSGSAAKSSIEVVPGNNSKTTLGQ